jgi:hypothetical protein
LTSPEEVFFSSGQKKAFCLEEGFGYFLGGHVIRLLFYLLANSIYFFYAQVIPH